jgi:hypothetical protein
MIWNDHIEVYGNGNTVTQDGGGTADIHFHGTNERFVDNTPS